MRHLTGRALLGAPLATALAQRHPGAVTCLATHEVSLLTESGLRLRTDVTLVTFDTRAQAALRAAGKAERDSSTLVEFDPLTYEQRKKHAISHRVLYLRVTDHDRQQTGAGVHYPRTHKLRITPSEAASTPLAKPVATCLYYPTVDAAGDPVLTIEDAVTHLPALKLARTFLDARRGLFDTLTTHGAHALLEGL